MRIKYLITLLNMIFISIGYANNCSYIIEKVYFNNNILTYYLDAFNRNDTQSNIDLFSYRIIPIGDDCQETLSIEYTFKIYTPEIGLDHFETFYKGEIEVDISSSVYYFKNSDFSFLSGLTFTNNNQVEKLISYISQSGKLPNGIYSFHFRSENSTVITPLPETIEIMRPVTLELLSPGGTLSELTHSYTQSTVPLFTWYSDFCRECAYGIRVCEYNQDKHSSLNSALDDWSIIPYDQSSEYHKIPWNTLAFQYPDKGHLDLEVGKLYVWQIRRSYETTHKPHHDYSPIYIFEIRPPTKKQLDFIDPYMSAIQTLIGKEQFNLWFSAGGELERFVTASESILINGEAIHMDALYSLVSELNQGKITINKVQIK